MSLIKTRSYVALYAHIMDDGLAVEINDMAHKLDQKHELVLRRDGNRIVVKRRVFGTTSAWEKLPEGLNK